MEKYHLSIKKVVNEINQRLKLWARVSIAVSLCPAAAHMYSFISFLSLQLNGFPQSELKQLSSIQKITFITAIADQKIIIVFCVSGGILPTSVCCSN